MDDQSQLAKSQPGISPAHSIKLLQSKYIVTAGIFVLIVLTLLPIVTLKIIITTGANNLSNDYALFLPLIDNILSGSYNWVIFFRIRFCITFNPCPFWFILGMPC